MPEICKFCKVLEEPCARDLQLVQGFGTALCKIIAIFASFWAALCKTFAFFAWFWAALCKRFAIFARCWAVCKEMPLQCVRYPRTSVALPHKLCTTYENQPLKCARYARTLTNKAALCQKVANFARCWKSPVPEICNFARFWDSPMQKIYNFCEVLEQPCARDLPALPGLGTALCKRFTIFARFWKSPVQEIYNFLQGFG